MGKKLLKVYFGTLYRNFDQNDLFFLKKKKKSMLISRSEKFVSLVIIIVLNLPSISIRCSLISLQPTRFTSEENCLFISSKLAEGRAHTCWASVYSVKRYNLCPESQMRRLSFCFDSRQQPKKSIFLRIFFQRSNISYKRTF